MDCASCLKILSSNSEFGCGFLVFGCFSMGTTVCNLLGLLFMLSLGFTVLQYGFQFNSLIRFLYEFREKSCDLIAGVCLKTDNGEVCESKSLSCNFSMENLVKSREILNYEDKEIFNLEEEEEEGFCTNEDEVFDVLTLRRVIKIERRRANAAFMELEKERMAAASAAEEAMAMILRLQNEKSSIVREAEQYRKMAGHKQLYDKEVIESLRWMVMKHESQRSLLEDQLKLIMKKDDQFEGFDPNSIFSHPIMENDGLNDIMISSLEMDFPVGESY